MASINKVILIGNLGRDPEVRYAQSGVAVCSLSVATTRNWKDKHSGEKQEETEWHRVVLYDRMAENAGEYLSKGKPVYIEGRLKTRKWTDKDGVEKYTTEIVGEQMQFLAGRDDGGGGERQQGRGALDGRQSQSAGSAPRVNPRAAQQPKQSSAFDDMDDDIPF